MRAQLTDVKEIAGTCSAFAAIKGDGSVVCWGVAGFGSDCGAVQEQLTEVKEIAGTSSAFAAIKGDGSVVCWGSASAGNGGDCVAQCRSS